MRIIWINADRPRSVSILEIGGGHSPLCDWYENCRAGMLHKFGMPIGEVCAATKTITRNWTGRFRHEETETQWHGGHRIQVSGRLGELTVFPIQTAPIRNNALSD